MSTHLLSLPPAAELIPISGVTITLGVEKVPDLKGSLSSGLNVTLPPNPALTLQGHCAGPWQGLQMKTFLAASLWTSLREANGLSAASQSVENPDGVAGVLCWTLQEVQRLGLV